LRLETDAGVMRLIFNRPKVHNCFDLEMIDELHKIFSNISQSVHVISLEAEGKTFCSGGDLNWMKTGQKLNYDQNLEQTTKLTEVFSLMYHAPVPLITLIKGACIGGGIGFASVSDHVISVSPTIYAMSEVRYGLIPACIAPFLLRKVFIGQIRSHFLFGEKFNDQRALEIGLINEICESETKGKKRLESLISNVLESGPSAVKEAKRLLLSVNEDSLRLGMEIGAQSLAKLRMGSEAKEGITAFFEKRSPKW